MAVREGCYGRGKRINHEEDCPSIAVICNTPRCINGGLRGIGYLGDSHLCEDVNIVLDILTT